MRCVSGKACGAGAWVDADGADACMAFSFGAWYDADGAGACMALPFDAWFDADSAGACMAFSFGAWFGVYCSACLDISDRGACDCGAKGVYYIRNC